MSVSDHVYGCCCGVINMDVRGGSKAMKREYKTSHLWDGNRALLPGVVLINGLRRVNSP